MRAPSKKPKHKLKEAIVQLLVDRCLLDDSLIAEIPTSYEMYGGLILFNHPSFANPKWKQIGDELWKLVCSVLQGDRIAIKKPISADRFRSPDGQLLFGDSSIAHFNDNGIQYSWNITKTMFSRGNVSERHRVASLDCSNEVIVDLFAGIGYFTVPYLVHAKARHVHACEWNSDAVEFLRYNLTKNRVADRCTIYEGDNRLVCPEKVAHRVNLGLLPSSEGSWETACRALCPAGGLLYVHQNVESKVGPDKYNQCDECERLITVPRHSTTSINLPVKMFSSSFDGLAVADHSNKTITWKRVEWFLFSVHLSHCILKFIERHHNGKWNAHVSEVFRVKSYAPHVDHVVFTVKCSPCFYLFHLLYPIP